MINYIFYVCKGKPLRDGCTLRVDNEVDEQQITRHENKHVHNIIRHLFFAFEKDVKMITSGTPVVIPPSKEL